MQAFPSRTAFLNVKVFFNRKLTVYSENRIMNMDPNAILCKVIHISGICTHVAKDNYAHSFPMSVQHM